MDRFAVMGFSILLCGALQAAPDVVLAITGARMLDGVRSGAIPSSVVLIGADGGIAAAGSAGEVTVPSGVRVIRAEGMTLLPGLIDGHVHLAWDKTLYTTFSAEDYKARLKRWNPNRALVLAGYHAQLALAATSARLARSRTTQRS